MSNDGRRDHLLSAGRTPQEAPLSGGLDRGDRPCGRCIERVALPLLPDQAGLHRRRAAARFDEMAKRLAPDPELPPIKRLDASLDAYLDFVEEHSAAFAAIFRASGADREVDAAIEEGRNAYLELLITSIVDWPEAPVATERTPLLEGAVQGWILFCEGAVLRWLEHGGWIATRCGLCCETLSAAPSSRPQTRRKPKLTCNGKGPAVETAGKG